MVNERPTKKQRELLNFIREFIQTHGYGPSYREIMRALEYKSVSTVAVHVEGLITRGWLRKTDHSARSLKVVASDDKEPQENEHITWLKAQLKNRERQGNKKEAQTLKAVLDILDQQAN